MTIDAVCDYCNKKAEYDAKTLFGPWAYLCEMHFKMYGSKTKGLYSKLNKDQGNDRVKIYKTEEE